MGDRKKSNGGRPLIFDGRLVKKRKLRISGSPSQNNERPWGEKARGVTLKGVEVLSFSHKKKPRTKVLNFVFPSPPNRLGEEKVKKINVEERGKYV